MTHYHVGHNIPGYLPEGDIYSTEDLESATVALADDLDRVADHLHEMDDPAEDLPFLETSLEELQAIVRSHGHRGDTFGTLADIGRDGATVAVEDGSALPVLYWLRPCVEEECVLDAEE